MATTGKMAPKVTKPPRPTNGKATGQRKSSKQVNRAAVTGKLKTKDGKSYGLAKREDNAAKLAAFTAPTDEGRAYREQRKVARSPAAVARREELKQRVALRRQQGAMEAKQTQAKNASATSRQQMDDLNKAGVVGRYNSDAIDGLSYSKNRADNLQKAAGITTKESSTKKPKKEKVKKPKVNKEY